MRKLLVSLLALAMLLGLGGMAFAGAGTIAGAAFSDIAGHEAEGDLTLLAALGVFTGDSGLGGVVKPDDPITRAQFCKVVVAASGKASTAAGLAGLKPTFTDGVAIPTWAWGYVNCATYMGVINGYADGTFGANNPVTYGEAVTMLVRVVSGHNAQVPPGIWPYTYLFYGVDEGFVGGVDVGFANLPCTRGDMARMLVATMWVQKVNKDGVKTTELTDPADYDSSILGPKTAEGVVTTFALGTDSTITVAGNALSLAAKVYVVGGSNYPGLLGLNVWAVKNADAEVVAILVKQATDSLKGVFAGYLNEDPAITLVSTVTGEAVGVGDATNANFNLDWFPITALSETIKVAGVAKTRTTHYTIDNVTGAIVFTVGNTPAAAEAVTADYAVDTKGNETYELADGTKVPISFNATTKAPTTSITINGASQATENLLRLRKNDECTFTLGADGKATNVTALRFDIAKCYVTKVTKSTTLEDTQIAVSGAGVGYEIKKAAAIAINASNIDRDSLAQYDVLFIASTLGDTVYNVDTNPVYAVRGARQSIEGTVKSYRTVFAGGTTTYYSTFELADKTTKEYAVAVNDAGGNIVAALTAGTGKFGLDAKGKVYVRIAYETATPNVLVKSFTQSAKTYVTVDMRGTEITYETSFLFLPAHTNEIGLLTINADTNIVTNFVVWVPAGATRYDIAAVDVANGNITLLPAGGTTPATFVLEAVVYKHDVSDDSYTYVPAEQVGLWKTASGNSVFVSDPFVCYEVP